MARIRQNERTYIDQFTKKQILTECGYKCAHCGKQLTLGKTFTLDHAVPLNKGGENSLRNYVALCEECNLDKGDAVVNAGQYYKHLPEPKRKALLGYVDEYMEAHDWLQYHNLLQYDWFETEYYRTMLIGRGTRVLHQKHPCLVKRLTTEQAFQMIKTYEPLVDTSQGSPFVSTLSEMNDGDSYYAIMDSDTFLMGFSAYILPITYTRRNPKESERPTNTVIIDLFRSPNASKFRPNVSTKQILAFINVILTNVQHTFKVKSPGSVVWGMLRAPRGDDYMANVFAELDRTPQFSLAACDEDDPRAKMVNDRIVSLHFMLFQGSRKEAEQMDLMDEAVQDQLLNSAHAIDERLNKSQQQLQEHEEKVRKQRNLEAQLRKLSEPDSPVNVGKKRKNARRKR